MLAADGGRLVTAGSTGYCILDTRHSTVADGAKNARLIMALEDHRAIKPWKLPLISDCAWPGSRSPFLKDTPSVQIAVPRRDAFLQRGLERGHCAVRQQHVLDESNSVPPDSATAKNSTS